MRWRSADVNIFNCYFDDNLDSGFGLHINTFGAIILTKGSASGNFLEGAFVDNYDFQTEYAKPITVKDFIFDNNGGYGLTASSNAVINITNISASGNGGYGASLRNETGRAGINLLVSSGKVNKFSNNVGYGLYVNSKGAVILNQSVALDNGEYGVTIFNQYAASANVTVTGCEMSGNGTLGNGLTINTKGAVLINNLVASDNAGSGLSISDLAIVSNTKTVVVNEIHHKQKWQFWYICNFQRRHHPEWRQR